MPSARSGRRSRCAAGRTWSVPGACCKASAASSLGVYGVIIAGWASNSKYPFFSALRAAAQMVSYEVSIGFVLICVVLYANTFNMSQIVLAQKGHGLGIV